MDEALASSEGYPVGAVGLAVGLGDREAEGAGRAAARTRSVDRTKDDKKKELHAEWFCEMTWSRLVQSWNFKNYQLW